MTTHHQYTINAKAFELSDAEVLEMEQVGIVRRDAPDAFYTLTYNPPPPYHRPAPHPKRISVPGLLNEASDYGSAFARAVSVELRAGDRLLLISGTASVDEKGATLYPGDFRAQLWRTYRNLTGLLTTDTLNWFDVVRTTCYLRDIERDYAHFNQIRTQFFVWLGLHPYPASTGIQAILCRSDLLVEIEVMALRRSEHHLNSTQ